MKHPPDSQDTHMAPNPGEVKSGLIQTDCNRLCSNDSHLPTAMGLRGSEHESYSHAFYQERERMAQKSEKSEKNPPLPRSANATTTLTVQIKAGLDLTATVCIDLY